MVIAVDVAGGDYAPHEMVKGALQAAKEYKLEIALVGRETVIRKMLRPQDKKLAIEIVDASEVIESSELPVQAIRAKPNSSTAVGTRLVKDKKASAFVSAGSTGAVIGAAYLMLDRIPGVYRPALGTLIQTSMGKPVLLLDSGANPDCRPELLVQFANLGEIFANEVMGITKPEIALLNNGSEEMKGNLLARKSYQLLRKSTVNFVGNIEGHEILQGKADVIVTDGFTGNIVLKTLEGLGALFGKIIYSGKNSTLEQQLQGPALANYVRLLFMAKHTDYTEYGGACLLGLDGNIIVCHGRSRAKATKNAVYLAHRMSSITERITSSFQDNTAILESESMAVQETPGIKASGC